MIRMIPRRTADASYYVADRSLELDGVRDGPPGYWIRGNGPLDTEVLERSWRVPARSPIIGYDLIVAAPRTTSVLLALGKIDEQRRLVADHREAVQAAVSYLEARALVVTTKVAGEGIEQRGRWSSIVSFTHGVNRIGEPHLHDHVLVGAMPHHRSQVLSRQSLSAHLVAADAIYRSELRLRISQFGVRRAWRTLGGIEIVQGVDEGHRALWPGDRDLAARKTSWTRAEILNKWKNDLGRFEPIHLREPPLQTAEMNEQIFGAHFEGLLSVARRDLIAATANGSVFGLSRRSVENFVDMHYPELASDRGLAAQRIGVTKARQGALVNQIGPRPLEVGDVAQSRYRERLRSAERSR